MSSDIQIIEDPSIELVARLAMTLRDSDKREVKASSGLGSLASLVESLRVSQRASMALASDGSPLVLWGLRDALDGSSALVWMLCSEEVSKYPVSCLKVARKVISEYQQDYELLFNFVACENIKAVSFIKAIGFKLVPFEFPLRDPSVPFKLFVKTKE